MVHVGVELDLSTVGVIRNVYTVRWDRVSVGWLDGVEAGGGDLMLKKRERDGERVAECGIVLVSGGAVIR